MASEYHRINAGLDAAYQQIIKGKNEKALVRDFLKFEENLRKSGFKQIYAGVWVNDPRIQPY